MIKVVVTKERIDRINAKAKQLAKAIDHTFSTQGSRYNLIRQALILKWISERGIDPERPYKRRHDSFLKSHVFEQSEPNQEATANHDETLSGLDR